MYDSGCDSKWDSFWEKRGIFRFAENDTSRPVFSMDTPPPNTTGGLHMGHVLDYITIDILARYKRLAGYNVFYPQGWDTQGFPTETAVEKAYGKGMGRDAFYARCVEMATESMQTMKGQMRRLGCTFDERYEYVTMSPSYRKLVQLSLIEMHKKGFVYVAKHPVYWCTHCNSAIAREETTDRNEKTALSYVNFKMSGRDLTIATTRPELMHACVAIAVNPKDDRFRHLIGGTAEVPMTGRSVPIVGDDGVEMAFGTGAEMVCTFGDKIDIEMYYRHKLELIEAMDDRGRIKNSGKFDGKSVTETRKGVLDELKKSGSMVKQERIDHTVKVHDRCGTPIELIASEQWFIRTKEHASKIKELADEIEWVPAFAKQHLVDWADHIDWDWAISRNRIFGTPLPFWRCSGCGHIEPAAVSALPVDPAKDKPPLDKCPKCGGGLSGETATCDVWVDSSITPLVIAGWPDLKSRNRGQALFPSSIRPQGVDIIRTWAFYTIFRAWALTGSKAFERVVVHSMILGPDGREMHKSWGNAVDVDELVAKYPIDDIRLWVSLSGAMSKDRIFSYKDVDFAKSFITKLYNSAVFVKKALDAAGEIKSEPHESMNIFDVWILNEFNSLVGRVKGFYDAFNLYEATNAIVNFYWHTFCDFYIEDVKYRIYSNEDGMAGSRRAAAFTLRHVLLGTLKLIAPVAPHAAEEINSMISDASIFEGGLPEHTEQHGGADYVVNGVVFRSNIMSTDLAQTGALLNDIISDVRRAKAQARIALNHEIGSISVTVPQPFFDQVGQARDELRRICNAKGVVVKAGADYAVAINI